MGNITLEDILKALDSINVNQTYIYSCLCKILEEIKADKGKNGWFSAAGARGLPLVFGLYLVIIMVKFNKIL